MTIVDLLSDTVYRDQARQQLNALLDEIQRFPVKTAQIYGLRQIARQQPLQVKNFAGYQRTRAERKNRQSEVQFWQLVERLCDSRNGWSVRVEGAKHVPPELETRRRQREWRDRWEKTHVPAFFERFCTHALYRLGVEEYERLRVAP